MDKYYDPAVQDINLTPIGVWNLIHIGYWCPPKKIIIKFDNQSNAPTHANNFIAVILPLIASYHNLSSTRFLRFPSGLFE